MEPPRQNLQDFLRMVLATEPDEIDCETFIEKAAVYIERLKDGGRSVAELRMTVQHIEVCPQCKEEFEALLEAYGLSGGEGA